MDFAFFWYPEASDSPILSALGGIKGLLLPHLVPAPPAGVTRFGPITPRTLFAGILAVGDERPVFVTGPRLTPPQLLRVLRICADHLRFRNVDEAAARITNDIRHSYGTELARTALRRAVVIIPDSVFARGNLVADLFVDGCHDAERTAERFSECAGEFERWRALDTSPCQNEAIVWYAGLASLTWLDRRAERDPLLAALPDRVTGSAEWEARFAALREAPALDVAAVRLQLE